MESLQKPSMAKPNVTESPATDTGSATGAKVACCVILLLTTLLLVLLPVWIWRRFQNRSGDIWRGRSPILRLLRTHGLSALNCLAGGVFLATAMLHIIVDAQEAVEEGLEAAKQKTTFPVANAAILAGILIIMLFEQFTSFVESSTSGESQNLLANTKSSVLPMRGSNQQRETDIITEATSSGPSSVNSLILVLAVSIHSIFEGLAIGLQTSSTAVYRLLLAVSFHKIIVTVSLGLQIARIKRKLVFAIIFGIVYSSAAPLGVFIGSMVASNTDDLTVGIMQSLACGTFIYVAAFEILPEELRSPKRSRSLCVGSFALGLALVVIINLAFPHDHSHEHHHDHH